MEEKNRLLKNRLHLKEIVQKRLKVEVVPDDRAEYLRLLKEIEDDIQKLSEGSPTP